MGVCPVRVSALAFGLLAHFIKTCVVRGLYRPDDPLVRSRNRVFPADTSFKNLLSGGAGVVIGVR